MRFCVLDSHFRGNDGMYSGLTKTSTALPRLSSKRTIL
ncbi:AzlC family protein [Neisseria meningitidis]|nr:AzlC family protein [Neisseria meningitidis]